MGDKVQMDAFNRLIDVVDELLGENGCPWDRKQTMKTIRGDLLEEASELIEAIDSEDNHHIEEELGDLFFSVIFLIRLAEKENRTTMEKVLTGIKEKLIRRHPHVFGEEVLSSEEALLSRWNEIKLAEKGKEQRKSLLDGIPKNLPSLQRADKILKKIDLSEFQFDPNSNQAIHFSNEDELGNLLLNISLEAKRLNLHPEFALKSRLIDLENAFRDFEKQKG